MTWFIISSIVLELAMAGFILYQGKLIKEMEREIDYLQPPF